MRRVLATLAAVAVAAWLAVCAAPADNLHFVLLGDRTGEAQPGVYERIWRDLAATQPAFVLSTGDTIQGLNDATAEAEWREVRRLLEPYRRIPLYLAPGNHDIWSDASERLFRKYAERAPHYSFDSGGAHFAVLDNSRSDAWPAGELAWLESDLREHAAGTGEVCGVAPAVVAARCGTRQHQRSPCTSSPNATACAAWWRGTSIS